MSSDTIDRFWSKVNKSDGCWLWTGSRARGYGQVVGPRNGGEQPHWYTHRFAWEITHGAIPRGLCVCHHCDTPLCVRPDHLFLGTHQDNMQDAARKGRFGVRASRGLASRHAERQEAQRKSLDRRMAIYRAALLTKVRATQIADAYRVSPVSISRIRHGVQGVALARRVKAEALLEPVSAVQLPVRGEIRLQGINPIGQASDRECQGSEQFGCSE